MSLEALETRLLALEAGTGAHHSRIRDVEKALVERIADVDDDRRRGAVQLQRAVEARQEEQEARARRRVAVLWVALVLVLIAALAVPLLLLYQAAEERRAQSEALAELRADLDRVGAVRAGDAEIEARLAGLAGLVGEVSATLERLSRQPPPEAAPPEALTELAAGIEALEQRYGELARRLAAAEEDLARPPVAVEEPTAAPTPEPAAPALGAEPDEAAPAMQAEVTAENGSEPPAPAPQPEAAGPEAAPELSDAAADGSEAVEAEEGTDAAAAGEEPTRSEPVAAAEEAALVTEELLYALQLIGFRNLDRFREFASDVGLESPVWYLEGSYGGRPWYSLIEGLYPDYGAAQEALDKMPESIRALDPWIRPLPAGTRLGSVEAPAAPE
jgi:DamX protein